MVQYRYTILSPYLLFIRFARKPHPMWAEHLKKALSSSVQNVLYLGRRRQIRAEHQNQRCQYYLQRQHFYQEATPDDSNLE